MVYKIWCKEVDGPGLSDKDKQDLSFMDVGSRQDWGDVAADRVITVNAADSLAGITNADTLRIFAHGDIHKVGQMTAKQLAQYLHDHGLRQVEKIELVACGTAISTTFKRSYAQRLLEYLVKAPFNVAIVRTQGAKGDLAPDRRGEDQDAVTVPATRKTPETTVLGDAGKKTYSRVAGCISMRTAST
jgi:hypothetical protein